MTNQEKFIEIMNATFNANFTKDNMKLSCSPCGALKIAKEGCDEYECKKCAAWWQKEYVGDDEMFGLNKDVKQRDEIIFGKYEPELYAGGTRRFDGLSLKKLRRLVELNFIDLEDNQNNSPTVREFIEFMEKYPDYTVMGYTVSIDRDDYRVSLDGIEKRKVVYSEEEVDDFSSLFGDADEFDTGNAMYAWFD